MGGRSGEETVSSAPSTTLREWGKACEKLIAGALVWACRAVAEIVSLNLSC